MFYRALLIFGLLIFTCSSQAAYQGVKRLKVTINADNSSAVVSIQEHLKDKFDYIRYRKKNSSWNRIDAPANDEFTISGAGMYEIKFYIDEFPWDVVYWKQDVYIPYSQPTIAEELAKQYRPVTIFNKGEEYFPQSLEDILSYNYPGASDKIKIKISDILPGVGRTMGEDLIGYLKYNGHSGSSFNFKTTETTCSISSGNVCEDGDEALFLRFSKGDINNSTIYWDVSEEGGYLYLTYYFFYAFDPKVGSFANPHDASHAFDRESFTIKFSYDGESYVPIDVTYAGHLPILQRIDFNGCDNHLSCDNSSKALVDWRGGKTTLDWEFITKAGKHPIIYKAKGAHAIYPTYGHYTVVNLWTDKLASLQEPAGSITNSKLMLPDTYDLQKLDYSSLSYLSYSGYWVDVKYVINAKFPPFIRTPYSEWLSDTNYIFNACLNGSDTSNDCLEVKEYFKYVRGLNAYDSVTLEVRDKDSGEIIPNAQVRLRTSNGSTDILATTLSDGIHTFFYQPVSGETYQLSASTPNNLEIDCEQFVVIDATSAPLNNQGNRICYIIEIADSDGDGMPDDWEIANGLNPDLDDAAGDIDGDGINNLTEYHQSLQNNQPPSVPAGLTAVADSSSQINLSWIANTESDLAGYEIYKDGVLLTSVSTITDTDSGLTPETEYCYTIAAYDDSGNYSEQTDQVCATTLNDNTSPPATSAWQWVNPVPQGNRLTKIIWGGGKYIAVGYDGTVLNSIDSLSWSVKNSDTVENLYDIHWSGARFVAVGNGGVLLSSPDASIWTEYVSGTSEPLYGIASNGSLIVAVGRNGVVLSSTDGLNWVLQNSGTTEHLNSVIWNGNLFVTVGADSTILTSVDGVTWEQRKGGSYPEFYSVTWNGNIFIAVGDEGRVLSSGDGIDWVEQTSGTTETLYNVRWNNDKFIAISSNGARGVFSDNSALLISADGVVWTNLPVNNVGLLDITWDGTKLIGVGNDGVILSSSDGVTWFERSKGTGDRFLNDVIWSGDQYVAVGISGIVLTSIDGITWTESSDLATFGLNAITWGNGLYVTVGLLGAIYTSPDGITWEEQVSGTNDTFFSVVWNGDTFIAAGREIYSSSDGINWSVVPSTRSNNFTDLVWNGNRLVAIGDARRILTSINGFSWQQTTTDYLNLKSIVWNGSQFVAVGDAGLVLVSPDGYDWTTQNSGTQENLDKVIWNGNYFIAVGRSADIILVSLNGVSWTGYESGTPEKINDIIWANNQLLFIGFHSAILKCDGDLCVGAKLDSGPSVQGSGEYLQFVEGNPGIEDDGVSILTTTENFLVTYSLTADPKPIVGTFTDGVTITVKTVLPRDDAFGQLSFEFGYTGTECLVKVDDNDIPRKHINAEATYYSLDVMTRFTNELVRNGVSTSGVKIENAIGCDLADVSNMYLNRIEFSLSLTQTPIEIDSVVIDSGIVNRP